MDMSWWVALAAVVMIALVATLVDGLGRGRRAGRRPSAPVGRRTRPPRGPRGPRRGGVAPLAGEIWWADVPYEDGPGSKDRPCLVLSVRGERALVAKITSRYDDGRAGVIALPPGAVGDAAGRRSYLETGELRDVGLRGFRRRVGVADRAVWERVRHLDR